MLFSLFTTMHLSPLNNDNVRQYSEYPVLLLGRRVRAGEVANNTELSGISVTNA